MIGTNRRNSNSNSNSSSNNNTEEHQNRLTRRSAAAIARIPNRVGNLTLN